ncbi:MAG: C25 family cysteine peptidase [Bacteroidota bacterium]|nr:C25 family cysteine peptidase [Bacteroidota bacterium]
MSTALFMFDEPDTLIYGNNSPYPGIRMEYLGDYGVKGYHVVTVEFYPLDYNPIKGTLELYTDISFTIVCSTGNDDILLPQKQSLYSYNLSKSYIKGIVENPKDVEKVEGGALNILSENGKIANLKGMSPATLNNIPDYVIITETDLMNEFQVLADWKTQKGVYAVVVDKTEIYQQYNGYDNAEKIRNYLKDVYSNWGSSYVLLGGDTDVIPTRLTRIYSSGYKTDFPPIIADLDNDEEYEIVFILATGNQASIIAINTDGSFVSGFDPLSSPPTLSITGSVSGDSYQSQSCPAFSMADLDKDGDIEIVCGDNNHLYIWNNQGILMNDININNYSTRTEKAPIIADIDNDPSDLEIVVVRAIESSVGSDILAYKNNGQVVSGFPIHLNEFIWNSPLIDDIDNNGVNELIVTAPTKFYVWNTLGQSFNNVFGWGSYRKDAQNTAVIPICYFDNSIYEVNEDLICDTKIKLNGNLNVTNNSTLILNSTLLMHEESIITIQNGSTLKIENGGNINGSCNPNFSGTINVEPGGILELGDGGIIQMGDDGLIYVKSGTSMNGIFSYAGIAGTGEIILNDNNTCLNIEGDLSIEDDLIFTFTGDGYIKFSNPGGDATNNIFCGSGASIVLQGSGQNDKIMEV